MPYENIPGVKATYLDGAFKVPNTSSQPKILIIGPSATGLTNEIFNVNNVSVAELEFGSATEVLRAVHECVAQGASNIAIMRNGGQEGQWVLTDTNSATLTITPSYRDDNILGRYALIVENNATKNRFMVYDLTDEQFVYDSDEVLVLDEGIVTVEDTGVVLFALYDKALPDLAGSLDTVVTTTLGPLVGTGSLVEEFLGDITSGSAVATEGTDGVTVSLAERYAALNSTYHLLDYRDADFVIPTDVYIDETNVRDDATALADGTAGVTDAEKYGYFWKGLPGAAAAEDALGFVWEYRYQGQLYTYMTDCTDTISASGSDAAATGSPVVATSLMLTAQKAGKGGNGVSIEITNAVRTPVAAATVAVTETDFGLDIVCGVDSDSTDTSALAALAINDKLALTTLRSGVLASTLVVAAGDTTLIIASDAKVNLTGGLGGATLTHAQLTGETIPSAVSTRFAAGADTELREVNFAHQLASFCNVASTNWSATQGCISFKAPTAGFSRTKIASWVGVPPTLADDGTDIYIDAPSDNGSGILSQYLMVGEAASGAGYRSAQVDNGDSSDGYAWGGLIKTAGAALPNGSTWPYGINDADEATDSGGIAVDIGRHINVTYDWPILSNGYNGGTSYRGAIPATFVGKVVSMVENEEPIGINGILRKLQAPTRVHSTQIDDLAKFRIIGIRRDIGGALILTTAKTAAHPDSDYSRLSTIRCVNRMLSGIRSLARPYIGKDFSAQRLASLQAAIDGLIVAEQTAGIHQGAKARIEYTRQDKIMGRLTIKLRMVPPFSIESITVETSLAADESEL